MQKHTFYLLLFFSILLFSCQQEQYDTPPEPVAGEIRFETQTSLTRLAYDDDLQTIFTPGDAIGVFAVKRASTATATLQATGNYMQNVKYTLGTNGTTWTSDTKCYYPGSGDVLDFYAYYPYTDDFDPVAGTTAFAFSTDMMTARETGVALSTDPVALSFEHKLALLRLETVLPGWDALLPTVTGVKLVFTEAIAQPALNLGATSQADELTAHASATTDAAMVSALTVPSTYECFLPAYANGKLKEAVLTDSDDKTYTFSLQGKTITLGAGAVNNLQLNMPTDYSELPNCYVVKPGSAMYIPVYKAYSMWQNNAFLKGTAGVDLTGNLTAELLWMDNNGLLTNAANLDIIGNSENAVVKAITATNRTGNAVVAVKIGGDIRWSWHLWVTGEDVTATTYTRRNGDDSDNTARNYTFMDRNLGAINATVADAGSKDLYYQWGRKDPFVGSSDWTNSNYTKMYDASGMEISGTSTTPDGSTFSKGIYINSDVTNSNANIAAAVTQPQVFYGINGNPWGNETDQLWGAGSGKSPFDPCPKGWRVPDWEGNKSPWENLTIPNGQSEEVFNNNKGSNWEDHLGYYPAAGYRSYTNGAISHAGSGGCYWASSDSGANGRSLYFNSGAVSTRNAHNRSYGFSVRCVASQD